MMDQLFYSFLSGLSWLLGLDSSFVDFYRVETNKDVSSFLSLAVLLGLVNTVVFLIVKNKKDIDISLLLCVALPALISEILCKSIFLEALPGLRSAGWVILASCTLLYLIIGVEAINRKKQCTLLVVCSFAIPLQGSLAILFAISVLFKVYPSIKSSITNVFAGLLPLLIFRITKAVSATQNEPQSSTAIDFSLSFIAASAGAALALYLLFLVFNKKYLKFPVHLASAAGLALLFFTSRYGDDLSGVKAYSYQFSSMGTVCSVTIWESDKAKAAKLLKETQKVFDSIENTLSTYKPESELSLLNKNAHEKPVKCGKILWQNLMLAKLGYELSEGGFDVTIGPLVKLWGVKRKRSLLPEQDEIAEAKKLVGFNKLIIDNNKRTVQFPEKGFKIDFGGLTKGWAVDKAAQFLSSNGIDKGIINLGGNIYCFGKAPKGKESYNIGIKDPRNPQKLLSKVSLLGQSVSTSGNYEQFIIIDGTRYTHIIDPRTGMPITGVDSVTVITPSAAMADMLSTIIFIGGKSLRQKLQESVPDLSFLFMDVKEEGESLVEKFGPIFEELPIKL